MSRTKYRHTQMLEERTHRYKSSADFGKPRVHVQRHSLPAAARLAIAYRLRLRRTEFNTIIKRPRRGNSGRASIAGNHD